MNERSKAAQKQIARYLEREEITSSYDDATQYTDQTEAITYKQLFLEV